MHNPFTGRPSRTAGFTLIELVAVLVILGVIAAVAMPTYLDLRKQARRAALEALATKMFIDASAVQATRLFQDNGATVTFKGTPLPVHTVQQTGRPEVDGMPNGWAMAHLTGCRDISQAQPAGGASGACRDDALLRRVLHHSTRPQAIAPSPFQSSFTFAFLTRSANLARSRARNAAN